MATPAFLVIRTFPVVVNPAIDWVDPPEMVTWEAPDVNKPLLAKFPLKVTALSEVASSPEAIVKAPLAIMGKLSVVVPEPENVTLLKLLVPLTSVMV